jgi:hypothetical protein
VRGQSRPIPHRRLIGAVVTYVSDGAPVSGGVNQFHGPFNPEISPDGTKVAFEWFNDTFHEAPGCSDQTGPALRRLPPEPGRRDHLVQRYTRKRRTPAGAGKTVKRAGTVTFKLKARGKATITATFKPTSGARQKASKALTLLG